MVLIVVSCIEKRVLLASLLALFGMAMATAQSYRWEVIAHKNPQHFLGAVSFVDTLHGWTSGDSMYYTTDGGRSWPSAGVALSVPWSFRMLDTLQGWATGIQGAYTGMVFHTIDGGRSWQKQFEGDYYQLWSSWAFSPQRLMAAGVIRSLVSSTYDTAIIVETTDGGRTWRTERGLIGTSYNQVQFSDSLHGWINTRGFLNTDTSVMLRTSDGGKNWEHQGLAQRFTKFAFWDSLRGWAGDHFGGFFRSTDGGRHWSRIFRTLPGYDDNFSTAALSFVDSLYGWAFGDCFWQGIITEAIYHTTDGGTTWFRESVGLTGDLGSLDDGLMLDSRHGWAVSGDGAILAYRPVPTAVNEGKRAPLPEGVLLEQNYPNPFNGQTNISYTLPSADIISLTLSDPLGRTVRKMLAPEPEGPGPHKFHVDATGLASGLYFYRLHTSKGILTRSMLILK